LKKQGTFKWSPFINIGNSEIILTNSAPLKEYSKSANLKLSFHRENDNERINRSVSIAANGSLKISLAEDNELKDFFQHKSGWLTAQSDNPFLNGYYFDFFESGAVGADHIF
jgi:hypothetical protein